MATIQPIYMKEAVILCKLETTEGTDALPTSTNFLRVKDFSLTPLEGTKLEYEQLQAHFGNFDSEMATMARKLEVSVYLAGSGTKGVVPNADPLIQMAGAQATIVADTSVTYAPITRGIKSGSVYTNLGGLNYRFKGARGNAAITTDVEGYPMWKFSLLGLYMPLVDDDLPAAGGAPSARAVPVNALNSKLTLHGIELRASAFGLDFGNQYKHTTLMGYQGVRVYDRKSTYNTTFEAVPAATIDWEDRAIKGTKGALKLEHGLLDGNKVAIESAGANVGAPTVSNVDGVVMHGFTGSLVPTSAGHDDWSVTFT